MFTHQRLRESNLDEKFPTLRGGGFDIGLALPSKKKNKYSRYKVSEYGLDQRKATTQTYKDYHVLNMEHYRIEKNRKGCYKRVLTAECGCSKR